MLFRNVTMMQYPREAAPSPLTIDRLLAEHPLKPVGPMEMGSVGWVGFREEDGPLRFWDAPTNALWLAIGIEERMLPNEVVSRALTERLKAVEKAEGRKPGGRARKRIKDEVVAELMPKAFVRRRRTLVMLDLRLNLLMVDTSSHKVAEMAASLLRNTLGSFPALPLQAGVSPRSVLTGWVAGDPMPDGLALDGACELRDPADAGSVARLTNMELSGEEVVKHLEAGRQCTRLRLVHEGYSFFTIDENLVLRGVKLTDGAMDFVENETADEERHEMDVRMHMQVNATSELYELMRKAFKLGGVA